MEDDKREHECDRPGFVLPWVLGEVMEGEDNIHWGHMSPGFDHPRSALPWVEGEGNSRGDGMEPEFGHPRSALL